MKKFFTYLESVDRGNRLLMLAPDAAMPLKQAASCADTVLLIGAEGGFAPSEYEAAIACGFEPVSLGPRVLRTETAPLAALAVLQALWGDL